MPDTKEKEEAIEILQTITKDGEVISELAKDKNFKKGVNELNIEFKKLEFKKPVVTKGGITEDKAQKQVAESYYKQINEYLKSLERFTQERKDALNNNMNIATIIAGLLPLLLTLLSGGFFVLSNNLLSFITNAFSVVPPLFINSIKGKIEGHYKGAQLKATLSDMKYNIERLVAKGQLTDETQNKLNEQLTKIADELSKL